MNWSVGHACPATNKTLQHTTSSRMETKMSVLNNLDDEGCRKFSGSRETLGSFLCWKKNLQKGVLIMLIWRSVGSLVSSLVSDLQFSGSRVTLGSFLCWKKNLRKGLLMLMLIWRSGALIHALGTRC